MSTLAETIHELRNGYGFSIEDVARLAGLPSERVASIEQGKVPTVRELATLGNALAVDPADLHAGSVTQPKRTVARFRAPQGVSELSGHDARLLALAAECGRIGAELERVLGRKRPIVGARSVRGVASRPVAWRQGYTLGATARKQFAPDPVPLESVQGWMEGFGIHVAFVSFESADIEAASIFEPDAMPVVLLNAQSKRVQLPLSRRAILGHEVCHLLCDGGERDLTIVSRDHDDSPFEQRANGFAPSFLAPRDWVKIEEETPEKIALALAEHWGLTFEGAVWHAKNLGHIDPDVAEELVKGRRPRVRRGGFEPDVQRTPPELFGLEVKTTPLVEGLLSELIIQACVDGLITRGRAREVLSKQ